jgi:hypothetical protein
MPTDDPSNLPARREVPLDRTTIERVLARAAELQATAGGQDGESNLSESQLIEIGKEVGLNPTTLTQALAEERSRISVPADQGAFSSITGPAIATASRAVRGTPAEVLAAIDNSMQRDESLQVQRRFPDRMTWEPRAGWIGMIQRNLNAGGRGYHLSRATQVGATVVPIEGGQVLVRLDADLSESRSSRLKGGGAVLTAAALTGGALGGGAILAHVAVIATGGLAAVPLLIGAAVAYQIGKGHRQLVMRAQLALEQALDRLEFGNSRRFR